MTNETTESDVWPTETRTTTEILDAHISPSLRLGVKSGQMRLFRPGSDSSVHLGNGEIDALIHWLKVGKAHILAQREEKGG